MITIRTDAKGSELRGSLWLKCEEGPSSKLQRRTVWFLYGRDWQDLVPLFGGRRDPAAPGLPFGLLVKWAVKFLGDRAADIVSSAFPEQCLADFDLSRGNQWNRPASQMAKEVLLRIDETRGNRGIDLPAAHRSIFLLAERTKRITIDGVDLVWDKRYDEWHFVDGEMPLATAVKFAVRVLRDEKTAKEWPMYHIPWLADTDELAAVKARGAVTGTPVPTPHVSPIGLGSAGDGVQPLMLVSLNAQATIGLAQVAEGFQLSVIESEEQGAKEIVYLGDPLSITLFADWSDMIDTVSDLLADLSPEVVREAGGEMPLCPPEHKLLSFLYTNGASRAVQSKEGARRHNEERYGKCHGSSAISDAISSAGSATLWQRGSHSVTLQRNAHGELSIVGENGSNPVLTAVELLRLLALLLSDFETQRVRPLQFAPWLLSWHHRRFGGVPLQAAVQASSDASQEAPLRPPVPQASEGHPKLEGPSLKLMKLPPELSVFPPTRTATPAVPVNVLDDLSSPADIEFRQLLQKVLTEMRTELTSP